MLTCYRTRRRLGALLDGALEGLEARAAADHLVGCAGCRAEADALRRLRGTIQGTLTVPEPEWAGFWPGVVRGIEERRRVEPVAPRRAWWRPRWALGGALAGALLVSLALPRFLPDPIPLDASVIVSSATTEHPRGAVMVYSTPEKDVTVVWVFGLD